MINQYGSLLSPVRARETSLRGRSIAVDAESDRGRVVFSAPFRRLQQKAQVFSLEPNAAVRSRLTHSIEVAQVGRFIADQIVDKLLESQLVNALQARAFVTFVEVACLMHDLGNPPFGHFGEAAIAEWFRRIGPGVLGEVARTTGTSFTAPQVEEALSDFVEFDGNCQGLRIAALLQWTGDEFGLNLTYTSLASYLKYLRPPSFNVHESAKARRFTKKAGYFHTEAGLVAAIWRHFEIDPANPQRFPLAYIMEAADDIAYCISDLEDAIEKELINGDQLFAELRTRWALCRQDKSSSREADELTAILKSASEATDEVSTRFTKFRTRLSRLLSEVASTSYLANHQQILDGSRGSLIDESSPAGEILEILKTYCREKVYQHRSIQRKELAGLTAVRGLLNHCQCLLEASRERFEACLSQKTKDASGTRILAERKLLSIFPERHIKAYLYHLKSLERLQLSGKEKGLREWVLRAHLVTDFISGMTDDFAIWSFQTLSGIRTD
jgi:dGTPase